MTLRKIKLQHHLFLALAVLAVFIQAYRVPVNVIGPGLDQSFPHILNLFSFTSIRFGTDIVYTYGPLGFLLLVENVGHNLALGFAFWTTLYLIFSISIVRLIVCFASGWRLVTSIILAVLVAEFIDAERLMPCLVMLLLLLAYEEPQYRKKILAVCGSLTAIGLLIKFPIGIACAGMTFGSAIVPIKARLVVKNLFVSMLSMTLAFCSIWVLLNRSAEGIVAYFFNSFQLVSGYSAVMSAARQHENASLLSFAVALGLLVAVMTLLPSKRRVHTFLVMLFPLFVGWKHGVVRFDGHIIGLVSMAIFSAFLLFVMHQHRVDIRNGKANGFIINGSLIPTRLIAAIAILLIACIFLNRGLVFSGLDKGRYPLLSRSFMENMGGVKNSWMPGLIPITNALRGQKYKDDLDALASARLAGQKLDRHVLELLAGRTVDIYSYELGFVAANPKLNYHPKPVFQHFNAFTEKLDQLNADFFASFKRPDFLIMHHPNDGPMTSVDGRYPLYDDPIAFLKIMELYKPAFIERNPLKPQVAVLEYDSGNSARFASPVAFKNEEVHWNETITLPKSKDSSIIRLRVGLQKTIVSSAKEALFRLSPMYLVYVLSDGTSQRYRLVPTHLSSGVWISPLLVDYWSFYDFLSGVAWMGPKVVAIRFEADNPKDYPDLFTLTWEQIECETGYCGPVESRVFSTSGDHLTRSPMPINSSVLASFTSPVNSIAAVDVLLSTYAKTNKGTLVLEILDESGTVLRESKLDAALVNDNSYKLFVFDPLPNILGKKVWMRLIYKPKEQGMIAAWSTVAAKPDFDFRAYGH
jgi:hypothetical protein